jgi:Holliday junction resolvasome RuvABC endonuclease subunit
MKGNMITLALYPNDRGLGYACLENQKNIIDCGIVTVSKLPILNQRILERVTKFVDFYEPSILVVRRQTHNKSKGGGRIQDLERSILEYSEATKIPTHQYTRKQIQEVFELYGNTSKFDIARQIITWFPELSNRAPRLRKPWMNEGYNMGVFDAMSLAITHHYLMN